MNPTNKIFISCSMLLAFASNVQMQHAEDPFQPQKHLTLPPYSHAVIGYGIDETHLPIGVYTHRLDKSVTFGSPIEFYRVIYENSYVYTRAGEYCRVDIGDGDPPAGPIRKILQLAANKVVLIVRSMRNTVNPVTRKLDMHNLLVTVDMNTCVTTSVRHLPREIWPQVVSHHEDRFDVIYDNLVASYDADGREIREPRAFAFAADYSLLVVLPAPGKSSLDSFVVVTSDNSGRGRVMSLVDRNNGTEVTRILEFDGKDDFEIERDDGTLNFCRANYSGGDGRTTAVECVKYDEAGNEKSRQKMTFLGKQWFLDLKSTRDGSFVVFTTDSSNLYVTMKGNDDREGRTVSYALPVHQHMRITNFDERNGTFELAYENSLNREHGYSVMLQKYRLPECTRES